MNEKERYQKDLFEDFKYSISNFDNQALIISGGALGFSLTFIKDIAPFSEAVYVWILYLSLVCFIYTIGIGFFGHYLSLRQISKSIELVSNEKYSELKSDKWIPKINLSIVITLTLGILFMVVYCVLNIENQKTKTTYKIQNKQLRVTKELSEGILDIEGEVKTFSLTDSVKSKTTIKIK